MSDRWKAWSLREELGDWLLGQGRLPLPGENLIERLVCWYRGYHTQLPGYPRRYRPVEPHELDIEVNSCTRCGLQEISYPRSASEPLMSVQRPGQGLGANRA